MTISRAEALTELAADMGRAGDSVPGAWDGFAVVAEITALGVRVTGFRYLGDAPAQTMLMDADVIDAIAALRTASPGPNGELFDVYVARLDRPSGEIVDQAFSAAGGAAYRVSAATVADVGELVRPQAAATPAVGADPAAPDAAPRDAGTETSGTETPGTETSGTETSGTETSADVDRALATLTTDVLGWPSADPMWAGYAGLAYQRGGPGDALAGQGSVGFVYGPYWATPHLVGGDFHAHLRDLLTAAPAVGGAAPGAVLVRLLGRQDTLQARFVYPPASDQIRFTLADDALAARIRPRAGAGAYGLRPRPEPDRLSAAGLQARIEADVAASVRSVDPWRTFALAYDVPRDRVVAFLYGSDGTPEAFVAPLSPVADLRELREQSARPDGAKWAGAVVHGWPDGRVDVMFYGEPAIAKLLGPPSSVDDPDAAAAGIRPPADAPAERPRPPWPAHGGQLDRDALAAEVTAALVAAPDLAGPDWDRVAVVATLSPLDPAEPDNGVDASARAVRFYGEGGPAVVTRLGGLGPIGKLSRAVEAADGVRPQSLVLRGRRETRLDVYGFEGEAAQRLIGGDERMVELADWLRPG